MEKLILTFLSRKLKLKKLLKYLKVRKVPARNFYCGECSNCQNILIEKSRGKRRVGAKKSRKNIFSRQSSLKYFREKLRAAPEIPDIFLYCGLFMPSNLLRTCTSLFDIA